MPRVLNFKINNEGIVLDDILYDENGEFDDRKDLLPLGWCMWGYDSEEMVTWLEKHLVTNSHLYDRVDIDVEGIKNNNVKTSRVLNFKINEDGICLDDIMYDEDGEFDDREDLVELGMLAWDDDPEEMCNWLEKHLALNSHLYNRVGIDVEDLKGD